MYMWNDYSGFGGKKTAERENCVPYPDKGQRSVLIVLALHARSRGVERGLYEQSFLKYHWQKCPLLIKSRHLGKEIVKMLGMSGMKKDSCMTEQGRKKKVPLKTSHCKWSQNKNVQLLYCIITEWWPYIMSFSLKRQEALSRTTYKTQHFKIASCWFDPNPVLFYCWLPPDPSIHWITHIPQLLHCLVLCSMSASKGLAVHE